LDAIWNDIPQKTQSLARIMGQELDLSIKQSLQYAEYRLAHRLRLLLAKIQAEKARDPRAKFNAEALSRCLQQALEEFTDPPFVQGLGTGNVTDFDGRQPLRLNYVGFGSMGGTGGTRVRMIAGNHNQPGSERELPGTPFANNGFTGVAEFSGLTPQDTFVGLRYGDRPNDLCKILLVRPKVADKPVVNTIWVEFTKGTKSTTAHIDVKAIQGDQVVHTSEPQPWPPADFVNFVETPRFEAEWRAHTVKRFEPGGGGGYANRPGRFVEYVEDFEIRAILGEKVFFRRADAEVALPPADDGMPWIGVYGKRGKTGEKDYIPIKSFGEWSRSLDKSKPGVVTSGLFFGLGAGTNSVLRYHLPVDRVSVSHTLKLQIDAKGAGEWRDCQVALVLTTNDGRTYEVPHHSRVTLVPNSARSSVVLELKLPGDLAK
jgi:hypothetical protein